MKRLRSITQLSEQQREFIAECARTGISLPPVTGLANAAWHRTNDKLSRFGLVKPAGGGAACLTGAGVEAAKQIAALPAEGELS